MDYKQYDYVLTIAEEKSFSKAAKRLFISQPSLSQYINRLEQHLGVSLFDRSTSPLCLTYEGQLFIDTALKIKHLNEELKKKYDDISELKSGRLNIGLTPSKANNPLPQILPVFKRNYPNIELIITEASSSELEDLLIKGVVDVCMMNLPISNKNIEYEPIFNEKILLAAPSDFICEADKKRDVEKYPQIDIKLLEKEQFILLKPNQRLRQIGNSIFSAEGFKPKILLETRSIETSLRLVAAGMGFCFVPESTVMFANIKNSPKYYTIGSPALIWTLVVAYPKDIYKTKAAIAFAEIAKQVVCKN